MNFHFHLTCMLLIGLTLSLVNAQEAPVKYSTTGKIHRYSDKLDTLLDGSEKIEILAEGYKWSEGPVWIKPKDAESVGYLLFSDVPSNKIFKWEENKEPVLWLEPFQAKGELHPDLKGEGSNGLYHHSDGRFFMCDHGNRNVSYLDLDDPSKRTVYIDNYSGKKFNSPNDLCFDSKGTMYFTDPPYGLRNQWKTELREIKENGVYRVSSDGNVEMIISDLVRPNGIALSPDETKIYVAQSHHKKAIWLVYQIAEDGTIGEGKILLDVTDKLGELKGLPDGLKIDQQGNLWATGPGGVSIISPEGELLGRIDTGTKTANCAWGNDGSVLYICAHKQLMRIKTKTKGNGW